MSCQLKLLLNHFDLLINSIFLLFEFIILAINKIKNTSNDIIFNAYEAFQHIEQFKCQLEDCSQQIDAFAQNILSKLNALFDLSHYEQVYLYTNIINTIISVKSSTVVIFTKINEQHFTDYLHLCKNHEIGTALKLLLLLVQNDCFCEQKMMITLLILFERVSQQEEIDLLVKNIVKIIVKKPEYAIEILHEHDNKTIFTEALIQVLNRQCQIQKILEIFTFINKIYAKIDEFFYLNDLKVVLDIIIRTLQNSSSQFLNQKCLETYLFFSCSDASKKVRQYRTQQFACVFSNIQPHSQNCKQLLLQIQHFITS